MPTNSQKQKIEAYILEVLKPLLDAPGELLGREWQGSIITVFLTKDAFDRLRSAFVKAGVQNVAKYFAEKTVPGETVRVIVDWARQREEADPIFVQSIDWPAAGVA